MCRGGCCCSYLPKVYLNICLPPPVPLKSTPQISRVHNNHHHTHPRPPATLSSETVGDRHPPFYPVAQRGNTIPLVCVSSPCGGIRADTRSPPHPPRFLLTADEPSTKQLCQCKSQAKLACYISSNGGCPKPADDVSLLGRKKRIPTLSNPSPHISFCLPRARTSAAFRLLCRDKMACHASPPRLRIRGQFLGLALWGEWDDRLNFFFPPIFTLFLSVAS